MARWVFAFAIALIFFGFYLLRALGLKRILSSVGYGRPKQAFAPFVSVYALGRAAESYDDGKAPARLAKPLLGTYIIAFMVPGAIAAAFLFSGIVLVFAAMLLSLLGIAGGQDMSVSFDETIRSAFMPAVVFSLLILGAVVPYAVKRAAALLRVYRIFVPKRAELLMIVSTLIPPSASIIIFAIRNREPNGIRLDERKKEGVI